MCITWFLTELPTLCSHNNAVRLLSIGLILSKLAYKAFMIRAAFSWGLIILLPRQNPSENSIQCLWILRFSILVGETGHHSQPCVSAGLRSPSPLLLACSWPPGPSCTLTVALSWRPRSQHVAGGLSASLTALHSVLPSPTSLVFSLDPEFCLLSSGHHWDTPSCPSLLCGLETQGQSQDSPPCRDRHPFFGSRILKIVVSCILSFFLPSTVVSDGRATWIPHISSCLKPSLLSSLFLNQEFCVTSSWGISCCGFLGKKYLPQKHLGWSLKMQVSELSPRPAPSKSLDWGPGGHCLNSALGGSHTQFGKYLKGFIWPDPLMYRLECILLGTWRQKEGMLVSCSTRKWQLLLWWSGDACLKSHPPCFYSPWTVTGR